MDLKTKEWDSKLVDLCGVSNLLDLIEQDPRAILGNIGGYYTKKYGVNPGKFKSHRECKVSLFTGDNPASLVGSSYGGDINDVYISLGTSDTLVITLDELPSPPLLDAHVFSHPKIQNKYMALLCFRNGSLAREHVLKKYTNGTWKHFEDLVAIPTSCFGFYHLEPEILPKRQGMELYQDGKLVQEFNDSTSHPRCVVESQATIMHFYFRKICKRKVNRIIVSGGASESVEILRVFSGVFGADVLRNRMCGGNAAAFGGVVNAMDALGYERETVDALDLIAHFEGERLGKKDLVRILEQFVI